MKKALLTVLASVILSLTAAAAGSIPEVTWDRQSLIVDGRRVMPVMGEIHYSRLPHAEWPSAVRKMKEGGVTIIATYVFWNHIEEKEGVFDWSGDRNLREFLEVCRSQEMPVVLRVGPFCHGEARCGGIPDWFFSKGIRSRSEEPDFLELVRRLYRQIFTQVQGLQWKDGGPLLACQFDNEYRGHGSYLMALKQIALDAGFDLPFYTRTGWPELKTPVPYGEMLPLFGDYADGFWERSTEAGAGDYYKAFNFRRFRSSTAIATEQIAGQKEKLTDGDELYPYFTCELGGGMMTAYHRRPFIYPEDAYSLAMVKLGSGSNLLGYYMYHGGTNPESPSGAYLNEVQASPATNYNDLPVRTYDFQAPLGEFGQTYPHYYSLRMLHLFMRDFGSSLAAMEPVFPAPQNIPQGHDRDLRWAYRMEGDSGFVFVNNYERLRPLSPKKNTRFKVGNLSFPQRPFTIPAGAVCIFPVNIAGIRYATAQPVARRNGMVYLAEIPGIPVEIVTTDGKRLKNVRPQGAHNPVYANICLLSHEEALRLFLPPSPKLPPVQAPAFRKTAEAAKAARHISIGVNNVAEAPVDSDFCAAAVYTIDSLPEPDNRTGRLLNIEYRGDVARLYCNGRLIADNFYNGRPMLYGLWRLPADATSLELRVLPLQSDMPVYFPAEASTAPGEALLRLSITDL
ncbi:MAG: beta-galactosidase [Muribaculaceae bacterium]|nr:beta-galactosidase [Muribaculaceae bacterium]